MIIYGFVPDMSFTSGKIPTIVIKLCLLLQDRGWTDKFAAIIEKQY